MTVYSILFSDPMFPATTFPVLMPTPIRISSAPRAMRRRLSWCRPVSILLPTVTALLASSLLCSTEPNTAMIMSPMYLSSTPSWANTISTMSVKYSLSKATVSLAPSRSEIEVKPRMSENSTLTSRPVPPSTASPLASSWSTTVLLM